MRILYYSCYEILEYDDLRLLTDAGHTVFSLGGMTSPGHRGRFRPADPSLLNVGDFEAWRASGCGGALDVAAEFARTFDVAIVNHIPEWTHAAVEAMGPKPVVYRSIGQSIPETERALDSIRDRIRVVRYANGEARLPGFHAADAVIYFGKRLDEFSPWRGGGPVRTFHNNYSARSNSTLVSIADWRTLAEGRAMELWGDGNASVAQARGMTPPEQQAELYTTASALVYAPVTPPSYTLVLMEALAHGTPILAPSMNMAMRHANPAVLRALAYVVGRYEAPMLLDYDQDLLFDDVADAGRKLDRLLAKPRLQRRASAAARKAFADTFDSRKVGAEWTAFLNRIA